MIKTYLFDSFYSKFSSMNSLKTFFIIILLIGVSFAQSARDMEAENPASDNRQENYRSIEAGKSKVIYIPMQQLQIFLYGTTPGYQQKELFQQLYHFQQIIKSIQ